MSYFDDNEDYLIHNSRPAPKKKKFFMEDYNDVLYEVNPCPKCGKAPERNNCGPEYQAVSCYECNVHASYSVDARTNEMLLSAIKNWNEGNFDEEESDGK